MYRLVDVQETPTHAGDILPSMSGGGHPPYCIEMSTRCPNPNPPRLVPSALRQTIGPTAFVSHGTACDPVPSGSSAAEVHFSIGELADAREVAEESLKYYAQVCGGRRN